jgi:hypothetical protein
MSWHPYPGRYESMQYRYCGKSGLRLPALSLGLWHSFGHVQPLDAQRALLRKPSTSALPISISPITTARRRAARRRISAACCVRTLPRTATS